jgi:hypothetical protein
MEISADSREGQFLSFHFHYIFYVVGVVEMCCRDEGEVDFPKTFSDNIEHCIAERSESEASERGGGNKSQIKGGLF